MDVTPEYRLIKMQEVLRICGMSRSTLYRLVAKGQFPAPLRLGPRAARWRLHDVIEWVDGLPTANEANWN